MQQPKEGQITKRYRTDFSGGVNLYLGPRQIKDNESPDAINCDFKGRAGVGNRQGYTEIGEVTDSRTKIYGMGIYHTATDNQLIKFASNGTNIALYYSVGEDWTAVTGTTFNSVSPMDTAQAAGYLFSANGTDTMVKYNGSVWASHTGASTGYYIQYFAKRLWIVDETNLDTLNFSTEYNDATKPLDFVSNGTSTNPGTITIRPGSGETIKGIKPFKNSLYAFTNQSIYRISSTSTANTWTVELITQSIGCVSHRSIAQVGEDLFFAADDGVYSLGDVANYTEVRTTNKSIRVQEIFDAISGINKTKLVGEYINFKYHLFYSLFGTDNDSCLVFDTRYQAWQDWRNIAANDATIYTNADGDKGLYFGEPTTGKVHQLYSGTNDNGAEINSYWKSKSFDEQLPDIIKLFIDSTFIFGALHGTVTLTIIFNDNKILVSKTLSQNVPQGGFGRDVFGRMSFGDSTNNVTITQIINNPYRIKAKDKKFAIQYRISSLGGSWRLDAITQLLMIFSHYKFPSAYKLT